MGYLVPPYTSLSLSFEVFNLFYSIPCLVVWQLRGSYLPYTCKQISRIFQTMSNSAGKDCQLAYLGSCVDLSTIVVCSDEYLTDRECVMSEN